jgi:glycosyltransferase involved in cell wall biosynthesis
MPSPGTVAVVIPCFNVAPFVGGAIETALHQTHTPCDVIVVNDGSRDDFHGAIAPYRSSVRIVEQSNAGLSAARNRGIDESDSEFIAFLDADDRWHPEKVARQVAFLRAHPECTLVHTRRRFIDLEGRDVGPQERWVLAEPAQGHCLLQLVPRNTIQPSTVLISRAALGTERFEPTLRGAQDWDLWLRLAAKAPFGYLDEPLTDYRMHAEALSKNRELMCLDFVAIMDRLLARAPTAEVRAAAERARRSMAIDLGHIQYETGNRRGARKTFLTVWTTLGTTEWMRLAATLVPMSSVKYLRRIREVLR